MEVHAHSHTPRKKWTHYFWEFLMLFLAVTLGFLVENLREHYIEGHRGEQYVRSYIEDLQMDANRVAFQIPLFEEKIVNMDSLLLCFKNKEPDKAYRYFWHASWFYKFFPIDRTMQQLKNAGGMRMIRKKDVTDSIIAYDRETKYIQIHIETALTVNSHELSNLENQIYDLTLIPDWGKGTPRNTLIYPQEAKLLTYDPKIIAVYKNKLLNAQRDYASQVRYLKMLKNMADRLIIFLKSKY